MDLSCNHAWVRVEENEHAGFGYRILSSTANHAARKPVPGTKCIEVGTGLTWTVASKDGEFFAIRKKAQPQWME